jgi:hypothetical protein
MGCWQQKHILKDLATAAIAAEAQLQTVFSLGPQLGWRVAGCRVLAFAERKGLDEMSIEESN